MECSICLGDEGEVVQKGCCCRGGIGAVHLPCLIELASHDAAAKRHSNAWYLCTVCKAYFNGPAELALVEAWVAQAESGEDEDERIRARAALGVVHVNRGDATQGIAIAQETLAAWRRLHGETHSTTLRARVDLANAYSLLGNYTESIATYRAVLEVLLTTVGPRHNETLLVIEALGCDLGNNGENTEGAACLAQVLAARKATKGEEHPLTLGTMYNLGVTLLDDQQWEAAEEMLSQLLPVSTRVLGEAHPDTLRTSMKLASVHLHFDRVHAAIALTDRAVELMKEVMDPHDRFLAIGLYTQALALSKGGRHDEAQAAGRDSCRRLETATDVDAELLLRCKSALGDVLMRAGHVEEGGAMLLETHAGQAALVGRDHWHTKATEAFIRGWPGLELPADPPA